MKGILKNFYRKFNKNYQERFLLKREYSYLRRSKKILDVGCGEGEFVKLDFKRIIGVDNNKKTVALCKKNGLSVVFGNASKIPFADDFFDGVRSSHLIEHLVPEKAYKMLAETGRVLKKGGIFVLSTPILWKGFYSDFTHIKPYYPESILRYLSYKGRQKTLADFPYRFEKVDFYWRYRPLPLIGKIGYLLSNLLYQYRIHSFQKDAYTLVLKKLE